MRTLDTNNEAAMMSASNPIAAGRNIPRLYNIEGAPFSIGETVIIDNLVDIETLEYRDEPEHLIGQQGNVAHYDYDCGCGQIFPDQPMIGVTLADGTIEEFWPEELISKKTEGTVMSSFRARVVEHLKSSPNRSDTDWGIMLSLYPEAGQSNPGNGARIANIRKLAYRDEELAVIGDDARTITFIG